MEPATSIGTATESAALPLSFYFSATALSRESAVEKRAARRRRQRWTIVCYSRQRLGGSTGTQHKKTELSKPAERVTLLPCVGSTNHEEHSKSPNVRSSGSPKASHMKDPISFTNHRKKCELKSTARCCYRQIVAPVFLVWNHTAQECP